MANPRIYLWIALALLLWMKVIQWNRDYGSRAAAASPAASTQTAAKPESGASSQLPALPSAPATPAASTAAPAASAAAPVPAASAPVVHVATAVLDMDISLRGGDLIRADLLKYPQDKTKNSPPVRLLSTDDTRFQVTRTGLRAADGRAEANHLVMFNSPASEYRLAPGAQELRVPLTWTDGQGLTVTAEQTGARQDDFADKALERFTMFALNQGEVCTCPLRTLIERPIFDSFLEKAVERTRRIIQGNPLDTSTMIGAQASTDQMEKILSYIDIGKKEGAKLVVGGEPCTMQGDLAGGYYVKPTIFVGNNKMRIFQEEIFGPVVSVTSFQGFDEALAIANDTLYGLGAGVWSRDGNTAYRMGRGIKAGRVWTNCYHAYPAHAAYGGYKQSGIGRETHKMMLDHYQQTKNLLVSYTPKALGFF